MATKKFTMTNAKLRNMYAALQILANRTLPTIASDLKVAKLLRRLAPYYDETEDVRKKKVAELQKSAIDDAPISKELRAAMEEMLQAVQEIEIQAIEIVEADLPVALKGTDGEKNREGIAAIVTDLGPLYELPED